ncbi:MAG: YhdP family protein, partial [Granulosicoccaceae bacterium]
TSEERPQQTGRNWFEVLSRFRWLNLKDSVITFKDQKRQRHYVVEGVTVVANHYDNRYRISVDGDLPDHLGERLSLVADLTGNNSSSLSGQMYLGMEQVNLTELGSAVGSEKAELSGRLERLEYWQEMSQGKSIGGQLQFLGEDLRLKRPQEESHWNVDLAELEMGWERTSDNWDIWLDNLRLAADGEAWQSGYTRFKRSSDGRIQAQGEQVRLGSISVLLAQLSNIEAVQEIAEAAEQYDPSGDLVSWRLSMEPDDQGRLNTAFEGVVSGFEVSSVGGRPGVKGLDALLRIKDNQLTARVNSADLLFEAPKVFEKPLHFDYVAGVLAAKLDPVDWWVRSDNFVLESGDATANTAFDIRKPENYPGLALNIRSEVENVDASVLPDFYPVGIMHPNLSKWLKNGVRQGVVRTGEFVLRGYSGDFPFRENQGVLRTELDVEGLELDYSPGWPLVTEADARVVITGVGLQVQGEGKFDEQPMEDFNLDIPKYRDGRILIQTDLETTGEAVREFARKGPMAKFLASHFEEIRLEGPVRLKLAPVVALKKGEQSSVEGVAILKGGRVDIMPATVDLRNVSGELPFDEKGLKDSTLKATLYGNPLTADLKRLTNNKGLQISARAKIPPARWLKERDNPLAEYLSGTGNWRVIARMLNDPKGGLGSISLSLTSDMRGVKIMAPAPVAKGVKAQRPFHIEGNIDSVGRSNWNFSLGQDLRGRFGLTADGDLRNMALGAAEPVPTLPGEGVRMRINWARADVASWYDFVDTCCLQGEGEGSYLDVYAAVSEASWYGAPIGSGSLSMIDDETGLTGRIDSRVASGNFRYNYRSGEEAWDIDLQRVNLTPFVEAEGDLSSSEPVDPRTIPVTRWNIGSLQLSDVSVQDIKITTSPVVDGLRVDRILISTDDYTGNGKGLWQLLPNGKHSSQMEMFLHANDLGRAARAVGRADAISGGRGQVSLNLLWQDALYQPDIATMSGDVKLEMIEGRINQVDPGAGRLFGLLALQTLPQRLALDFSDLGEGLSYTQVKGEFELADGLAKTRYLLLEGPIGAVSVAGDIDYVNQTFDQKMVILPNVGGSLPVIGAVVGGPVTAAGVFLADKIFKSIGLDVNRFGRRDYSLTGTFDEPVLEQISRPRSRASNQSDR